MAPERFRQLKDRYRNMKSGGGVLCIAALQLVVGLVLLGIYEGYKVRCTILRVSCLTCFASGETVMCSSAKLGVTLQTRFFNDINTSKMSGNVSVTGKSHSSAHVWTGYGLLHEQYWLTA